MIPTMLVLDIIHEFDLDINTLDTIPFSPLLHYHHLTNRYARGHCSFNQIGSLQFFPSTTSMLFGHMGWYCTVPNQS